MKKAPKLVILYVAFVLILGSTVPSLDAGDGDVKAEPSREMSGPRVVISQIELTDGVTVSGILDGDDDYDMYMINVDDFATSMHTVLTISNDSDFDVYGRFNELPTTDTYDWRGFSATGEDEYYSFPSSGPWYIMVHSWSGLGSYDLTVSIEYEEIGFPGTLENGITSNGTLLHEDEIHIWRIPIVNSTSSMRVILNCGNNDFDLYAARDRYPTRTENDWESTAIGGEDYTYEDPEKGTWYIMVYAFSGAGFYEITVILEPAEGFGFFEGLLDIFDSPILFWFILPAFLAVICVLVSRSCRRRRVDRGFVLDSDRTDMYQYGQTYEPRYCTYCGTIQKPGADICHECGARIPDTW